MIKSNRVKMLTVDELMNEAFDAPRMPRSPEYQAGVRVALAWKIEGIHVENIYRIGTAQADAFFSGLDEGYRIYRDMKDKESTLEKIK